MNHQTLQVPYQCMYNQRHDHFRIQLQVACDILRVQDQPSRDHFPNTATPHVLVSTMTLLLFRFTMSRTVLSSSSLPLASAELSLPLDFFLVMICERKEMTSVTIQRVTYFAMFLNLRELNNDTDRLAGLCLKNVCYDSLVFFIILDIARLPSSKLY
jgi:hypothetical protein